LQAESAIPLNFRRVSSNFPVQNPILDTAQLIMKFDEVIAETEQFAKMPIGKFPLNISSGGAYSGTSSPGVNPITQISPGYPVGVQERSSGKGNEMNNDNDLEIFSDGYLSHQFIRRPAEKEPPSGRSDAGVDESQPPRGDRSSQVGRNITSMAGGVEADSESDESSGDEADPHDHFNLFGSGTTENRRELKRFSEGSADRSIRDPRNEDQDEISRQLQDIMRLESDVDIQKFHQDVEPIAEEDDVVSDIQSELGAAMFSAERDSAFDLNNGKSDQRTSRAPSSNDSNLLRGRSRLGQVRSCNGALPFLPRLCG
jgi:hypothetical protein